jgi:hypothetical protein
MKENEKCQVKWKRRRNDIDVCALRWSLAPFNVDILREEYEEESLYCWRRENIQYKKVDMIVASLCSGRRRIFICVCKLYTTREREREIQIRAYWSNAPPDAHNIQRRAEAFYIMKGTHTKIRRKKERTI